MEKTIINRNLYLPSDNRIAAKGRIGNRRWWVVAFHGHPNAYVEILDSDFKNCTNGDLESLPVRVHGGITFAGRIKLLPTDRVVGWDYAHLGDYVAWSIVSESSESSEKIWTVEEIIDHCIYACGQVEALSVSM